MFCSDRAEDSQKMMEDMLTKYELMKRKLDSTKEKPKLRNPSFFLVFFSFFFALQVLFFGKVLLLTSTQ
jgi:hypothetical protein